MILSINMLKLKSNLALSEKTTSDSEGVFEIIDAAFNEAKICDINFDSISLNDAFTALEHSFDYVPYDLDDDDSGFTSNFDNPIHLYIQHIEAIRNLKDTCLIQQSEDEISFF